MQRNCDWCNCRYTAHRAASRFCSDRCRKRNLRAGNPQVPGREIPNAQAALAKQIRHELESLGLADTTPGMLAYELAERISAPGTSDSARAPLSRELMRLRSEMLRGVSTPGDPVDQIGARAQAKRVQAELLDRSDDFHIERN